MKPNFFAPITGSVMPRFAGLATLMRLPYLDFDHEAFPQVDIGLVGIPGMVVPPTAPARDTGRVRCETSPP